MDTTCATILVVEDDDLILESLQMILEGEGYNVVAAKNGREALDALRSKVEYPCLILLDLFMPIMDGWQFLDEIRGKDFGVLTSIPIVITSAAGDYAKETAKLVEGFIRKPIDLKLLLHTVERYCGKTSDEVK